MGELSFGHGYALAGILLTALFLASFPETKVGDPYVVCVLGCPRETEGCEYHCKMCQIANCSRCIDPRTLECYHKQATCVTRYSLEKTPLPIRIAIVIWQIFVAVLTLCVFYFVLR